MYYQHLVQNYNTGGAACSTAHNPSLESQSVNEENEFKK